MAEEGPNSPGTMADDDTVGTVAWTNPDYAKVSDNNRARAGGPDGTSYSHYLKATNFNFTIPSGATINGILVEIQKKEGSGVDPTAYAIDNAIKIVKSDGTIGSTNKADLVTHWPSADTYISYGNSTDLWGENWVNTDINNANFGIVVQALEFGSNEFDPDALINHIRITVYYTEAAGGGVGGIMVKAKSS